MGMCEAFDTLCAAFSFNEFKYITPKIILCFIIFIHLYTYKYHVSFYFGGQSEKNNFSSSLYNLHSFRYTLLCYESVFNSQSLQKRTSVMCSHCCSFAVHVLGAFKSHIVNHSKNPIIQKFRHKFYNKNFPH